MPRFNTAFEQVFATGTTLGRLKAEKRAWDGDTA